MEGARATVAEAEAELTSGISDAQGKEAHLAQAEAAYQLSEANRTRYEALAGTHEISKSEYEARVTEATTAHEQIALAAAELNATKTRIVALRERLAQRKDERTAASVVPQVIGSAQAKVGKMDGQLKESQAQLKKAQLNPGYTTITAPVGGIVGQRQIEMGQRVQTGQMMLTAAPANDGRVDFGAGVSGYTLSGFAMGRKRQVR